MRQYLTVLYGQFIMGDTIPDKRRDQRREAILDVARQVFLEEGYAATSMSTIAARLGGSKGTLYNYFKNKAELFEAYVGSNCAHHAEYIQSLPVEDIGIEDALTYIGERFLKFVLSDQATRFYRLIVAESQQNPNVGQAFYESGPCNGVRILSAYLERAKEAGTIDAEDCQKAAEEFFGLCHGLQLKRVLNVIPPLTDDEIHAEATRVARTFLKIYGVSRPAKSQRSMKAKAKLRRKN